jgi:hypothetical protein
MLSVPLKAATVPLMPSSTGFRAGRRRSGSMDVDHMFCKTYARKLVPTTLMVGTLVPFLVR